MEINLNFHFQKCKFGCDVDKMAEVVKRVEAIVEEREAILENMS